jgi:hypothetical protein
MQVDRNRTERRVIAHPSGARSGDEGRVSHHLPTREGGFPQAQEAFEGIGSEDFCTRTHDIPRADRGLHPMASQRAFCTLTAGQDQASLPLEEDIPWLNS